MTTSARRASGRLEIGRRPGSVQVGQESGRWSGVLVLDELLPQMLSGWPARMLERSRPEDSRALVSRSMILRALAPRLDEQASWRTQRPPWRCGSWQGHGVELSSTSSAVSAGRAWWGARFPWEMFWIFVLFQELEDVWERGLVRPGRHVSYRRLSAVPVAWGHAYLPVFRGSRGARPGTHGPRRRRRLLSWDALLDQVPALARGGRSAESVSARPRISAGSRSPTWWG